MTNSNDDESTFDRAREVAELLDDATRAIDDDGTTTTTTPRETNPEDVALFRRALRFAYLANHLGVRGWEDVEEPNPYLVARFGHRASKIARETSPEVLLRVVFETTRDRVAYVPEGNLPRLLGSLSEPDATACATLMLWAKDKNAAAERVSAVEGYACERARRDAVAWAEETNRADAERRGRFVTTYEIGDVSI